MKPYAVIKTMIAIITIAFAASCAKLPVNAVSLMQQIKDEGQRMHQLNLAYVNMMFESKNAEVDSFMNKEYIPGFIGNIKKGIDNSNGQIDMNKDWPKVFPKIVPVINAVRDSLRSALLNNKGKITAKLNEDYDFYKQACDAQISLLASVTKLNGTTRQIFNSLLGKATGNKTDLTMLDQKLEGFLKKGESISQKILFLNQAVETVIAKQ
jgi:hypothetical protein